MNLVTGATGILGSHVVLQLIQHEQGVIACKQKNSSTEAIKKLFEAHFANWHDVFSKVTWLDLDISDSLAIEDALKGVKNVYHCAGYVSLNDAHREKLFRVNEHGTRHMVNACLQFPDINFCHVGTISTINNIDYAGTLDETVFWKKSGNESYYAISKYNAEREVWRAMEEGLKAVIVNPGVILAPSYWNQSSTRIVHKAYKGNRYYTDGIVAYVWVKDVAEVMIRLVTEKKFSERFIVVENNYSNKEIMTHLQSIFHPSLVLKEVTKGSLKIASYIEKIYNFFTGKEPDLTKALINSAFNKQQFSAKKVSDLLSFTFRPSKDCLHEICENHKKGVSSAN